MPERKPVLLLGGHENTLAVARSLHRFGVRVSVSADPKSGVGSSRCCEKIYHPESNEGFPSYWQRLLIEKPEKELVGRIILCLNDEAVQFVSQHREKLDSHYILEENDPAVQLALLDKYETLEIAERAGIDYPKSFEMQEEDPYFKNLEIRFPVLVKPITSHLYRRIFKFKLLLVNNREELEAHLKEAYNNDLKIMLTEFIPGPDTQLCSYYTYIDKNGECLFDYTKSVIRRSPPNFGGGCYHITKWQPDVAEAGKKFLLEAGYRGIGNIEFKRDPRDGQLKVIESNPRFTAAHELLVRSGISTDRIVYQILNGEVPDIPPTAKREKRMIYLLRDFRSFRLLKKSGQLTFFQWLLSISHRQVFPYLQWSDPMPAVYQWRRTLGEFFQRRLGKRASKQ